ncbi:MAG: Shedu immune nuclease family protein [Bacteroidales bacterium]
MDVSAKSTEYKKSENSEKIIYHYKDLENNFDVVSRIIIPAEEKEIHYPFSKEGSQKYNYIKVIEYEKVSPSDVKGVYKAVSFGLGFTKNLSPLIYELEKYPRIEKIIISRDSASKILDTQIIFNKKELEQIFEIIKSTKENQSTELKLVSNNQLAKYFSDKFSLSEKTYKKGDLALFVENNQIEPDELSDRDLKSLISLIPKEIAEEKIIFSAEEKIKFIKLNKVKDEFKKLVDQKTDTSTLEENCQLFLTENSWIFSNILSIPVAILGTKTYVGGKSYENSGGKEADFLYRNDLTQNVCIFEIKTPLKKLFDTKTPYRNPDIYHLGKELTGGVVQLLDQRDNLQKDFYSVSKGKFNSFTPKCILIIGKISGLSENQVKCFELYRNSLSNIEIITFDELAKRTELILGEFIDSSKKRKVTIRKKKST